MRVLSAENAAAGVSLSSFTSQVCALCLRFRLEAIAPMRPASASRPIVGSAMAALSCIAVPAEGDHRSSRGSTSSAQLCLASAAWERPPSPPPSPPSRPGSAVRPVTAPVYQGSDMRPGSGRRRPPSAGSLRVQAKIVRLQAQWRRKGSARETAERRAAREQAEMEQDAALRLQGAIRRRRALRMFDEAIAEARQRKAARSVQRAWRGRHWRRAYNSMVHKLVLGSVTLPSWEDNLACEDFGASEHVGSHGYGAPGAAPRLGGFLSPRGRGPASQRYAVEPTPEPARRVKKVAITAPAAASTSDFGLWFPALRGSLCFSQGFPSAPSAQSAWRAPASRATTAPSAPGASAGRAAGSAVGGVTRGATAPRQAAFVTPQRAKTKPDPVGVPTRVAVETPNTVEHAPVSDASSSEARQPDITEDMSVVLPGYTHPLWCPELRGSLCTPPSRSGKHSASQGRATATAVTPVASQGRAGGDDKGVALPPRAADGYIVSDVEPPPAHAPAAAQAGPSHGHGAAEERRAARAQPSGNSCKTAPGASVRPLKPRRPSLNASLWALAPEPARPTGLWCPHLKGSLCGLATEASAPGKGKRPSATVAALPVAALPAAPQPAHSRVGEGTGSNEGTAKAGKGPPPPTEHVVADSVFSIVAGPRADSISIAALSNWLIQRGDTPLDKIQALFNAMDTDGDGSIGRQEWRVGFTAGLVPHD